MPLHIFSLAILEMNKWNEISKVCSEETQNNCTKYVISENSCSKNFVHFQEQHPHGIAFLNKVAGYLTLTGHALWEII